MSQIDFTTRSDSTADKSPARPSLLAAHTSARADRETETVSILSSLATLEGDTVSHSAGSRHTKAALGLLVLVAILATATWTVYTRSGRDQPAGSRPDAIAMPQRAAAHSDVKAAVAPVAVSTLIAPAPSKPAVIEDLAPSALAPPANAMLAAARPASVATIDAPKTNAAAATRKEAGTEITAALADRPALARAKPRSSSETTTTVGAKSPPDRHTEARAGVRTNTQPRRRRRADCRAARPRRQPACDPGRTCQERQRCTAAEASRRQPERNDGGGLRCARHARSRTATGADDGGAAAALPIAELFLRQAVPLAHLLRP